MGRISTPVRTAQRRRPREDEGSRLPRHGGEPPCH